MTQPMSFAEAHRRARVNPGVTLFTVSIVTADRQFVTRAYTSHEEVYPRGGLKPVGLVDPAAGTTYYPDRATIEQVFPEWELIISLGGTAAINVPLVAGGELIAVVNFFHDEAGYTQDSIAAAEAIAGGLLPSIEMFRQSQQ